MYQYASRLIHTSFSSTCATATSTLDLSLPEIHSGTVKRYGQHFPSDESLNTKLPSNPTSHSSSSTSLVKSSFHHTLLHLPLCLIPHWPKFALVLQRWSRPRTLHYLYNLRLLRTSQRSFHISRMFHRRPDRDGDRGRLLFGALG